MYISKQFSPGGDMDRADRLLVMCVLFFTEARCSEDAKQWFLVEFERLRSEAKAQIRGQTEQLAHLFGPPKDVKTTPAAPRPVGRPRKDKTPPVTPEPFKQPPI